MINKLRQWIKNISVKQAIFLIVIIGLLVYFNTLFNGFVWDDEEQILNNSIVHSLANFPRIFSGATFNSGGGDLSGWFFRPLITFYFMLNYAIWGAHAGGFHLMQFLWHIINAVILFLVLQKIDDDKGGYVRFVGLIVSLFFLVHPGIIEAVDYISAVSEVAVGFSAILSLYLILKWEKLNLKRILILGIVIFGGFLFKETGLLVAVMLILIGIFWRFKKKKGWKIISLSLTLLGVYFFLRLVLIGTPLRHPEYSPISEANLQKRILTIPVEFADYGRLVFYPKRLTISQHYVINSYQEVKLLYSLLIDGLLMGATILILWKIKSRVATLGAIWYLIGFGFVSNLFPLDMTIAERWLYFPIIGLMLFMYEIFKRLISKRKITFFIILSLIILPIFIIRTVKRNYDWGNGLRLYKHDITQIKGSFDLENNLGVELVRVGQLKEAEQHFLQSIRLQPKWYFAYNNVGVVYQRWKKLNKAEKYYLESINKGNYYLGYENLANLYFQRKKFKKANNFLSKALTMFPFNFKLRLLKVLVARKLGNKKEAVNASIDLYKLYPSKESASLLRQIQDEAL